jgi:apolipoprotein N-acyltransferase
VTGKRIPLRSARIGGRTPLLSTPALLRHRSVRFFAAALSGVLLACSFPNIEIGWLAFIALGPLVAAVASARSRLEAFLLGWLAYTISWLITVPWVIKVMSQYGGLPYATGVSLFVAMSLYLGLYGGLFSLLVSLVRLEAGFRRWLLVPLAWVATEYARTWLFSGFPWDLISAAIINYTALIRIDRWIGPYATGALVVLPSIALAWQMATAPSRRRMLRVFGSVILSMAIWAAIGALAVAADGREEKADRSRTYRAALIQPNISQEMRWSDTSTVDIFQRMVRLSEAASAVHPDVIIWPESTVPLTYASTGFYRSFIETLSRKEHADMIFGSIAEDANDPTKLWNAAYLVTDGVTVGHYDKIKLVPFGEYVPLRKMLFFARKLVHAVGEFQFGTRETPLAGKLRYGMAICYEIVFPRVVAQQVRAGSDVLVTITNDAWYDGTSAPRQHLNMARMRAVETDRYLLRAGTTGISAFVDPDGRLLQSLEMNRQGILFPEFHARHSETAYVRFGDWFAWLACGIVAVTIVRKTKGEK